MELFKTYFFFFQKMINQSRSRMGLGHCGGYSFGHFHRARSSDDCCRPDSMANHSTYQHQPSSLVELAHDAFILTRYINLHFVFLFCLDNLPTRKKMNKDFQNGPLLFEIRCVAVSLSSWPCRQSFFFLSTSSSFMLKMVESRGSSTFFDSFDVASICSEAGARPVDEVEVEWWGTPAGHAAIYC